MAVEQILGGDTVMQDLFENPNPLNKSRSCQEHRDDFELMVGRIFVPSRAVAQGKRGAGRWELNGLARALMDNGSAEKGSGIWCAQQECL
jgi:hypothetical protein